MNAYINGSPQREYLLFRKEVDEMLINKYNLTYGYLPDYDAVKAFESGISAKEQAKKISIN